jgi:aryl-alcohol dehydrogenase-like predicted oxidoreductase
MLERNPESYHNIPLDYRTEDEILPFCREHGLAFFPYSPLFQGLLSGKFKARGHFDKHDMRADNPKLTGPAFQTYFEMAEKLNELAHDLGKPLSQIAINWLIKHEAVTSVIGGARNVQQIESNIASTDWELTDEMMQRIESILAPYPVS